MARYGVIIAVVVLVVIILNVAYLNSNRDLFGLNQPEQDYADNYEDVKYEEDLANEERLENEENQIALEEYQELLAEERQQNKKGEQLLLRKQQLQEEIKQLSHKQAEGFGGSSLCSEKIYLQDYTPKNTHAIVTMMGCNTHVHSYWMGAIAMIQSLREVKTRVPNIVVMVRENILVPPKAYAALERLNVTIIDIAAIPLAPFVKIPGTWEGAFDKLTVWTLTQFEKVLFLDADTLIVQNVDHLLNYGELTAPYTPSNCQCNINFATHRDSFTISSGFFICEPSMDRFQQMVELSTKPSPDPQDAAFDGAWHFGDQEMLRVVFTQLENKWNPLDWEYDLPVGSCDCKERRTKPIYSYHFVCNPNVSKPWGEPFKKMFQQELSPICLTEVYLLWFRLFAKAMNEESLATSFHTHVDRPARFKEGAARVFFNHL